MSRGRPTITITWLRIAEFWRDHAESLRDFARRLRCPPGSEFHSWAEEAECKANACLLAAWHEAAN